MELSIQPLSPALLNDYLYFFDHLEFEENPNWSQCYCYSFHFTGNASEWNREKNRAAVSRMIEEGTLRGYIAYSQGQMVGWCNVNDRNHYQRLLKICGFDKTGADEVASIVCFVTSPKHRRKGVARQLLRRVINDYLSMNYNYLEAYPGKGKLSCEKLYRGSEEMYLESGFEKTGEMEEFQIFRKKLDNHVC
jgi:ribosomal protein S18 acetylase RimI-like enzyme